MSVTNYTPSMQYCRYNYSKLKDVLYLISAMYVQDIRIDEGEAYVDSISETPLKIEGFNLTFTEESSLDERYRFTKNISISVFGRADLSLFQDKFYAVLEGEDGTLWVVNTEFPSRVTYTYNLSEQQNQTTFTLQTSSNMPTLKLNATLPNTSNISCNYKVNGIESLKLLEAADVSYDTESNTIYKYTTNDFQEVEFLRNTFNYTEQFDGEDTTTTLDFDIAFDNYKSSWHYNLLEFVRNLYSAVITTKDGNDVLAGFNHGLQPNFSINSQDENIDTIGITLVEASNLGSNVVSMDSSTVVTDASTTWVYDKNYYECLGNGTAKYLVKREINKNGTYTGNIEVMDGYSFPDISPTGTFYETVTFNSPDCGSSSSCSINTNIPSYIQFNAVTCYTYSLRATCDWDISGMESYITVSPTQGVANTDYTVQVCNTESNISGQTSSFILMAGNNVRTINVMLSNDVLSPSEQRINCLAQTVTFTFDPSCPITVTSIDSRLTYQISYNQLVVQVPRNYSIIDAITWNISVTNCNGNTGSVSIIQDKTYEKWQDTSGFICDGTTSYIKQTRYTGTTTDGNFAPTGENRAGDKIKDNDDRCTNAITRFRFDGKYYCVNGNKMQVLEEEISYDNGTTWVKTGVTQLGDLVEPDSVWCDQDVTYKWEISTKWVCEGSAAPTLERWVTVDGEYVCLGTTKYTKEKKQTRADESSSWVDTGETRRGDIIIEENSTDCGYEPPSYTEQWVEDGNYVCEGTTKYAQEKRQIKYPGSNEWIDTGETRRGSRIIETNSPDCGYVPPATNKFSATYDDGSTFEVACNSVQSITTAITKTEEHDYKKMKTATVGSCVKVIGAKSFNGCEMLTSVTLPSTLTKIEESAFRLVSLLGELVIPDNVTEIGDYGVASNERLRSLTIGSGATTFGDYCFMWNTVLTSVTIPASVTNIGSNCFYNCTALTSITVNAMTPPTLKQTWNTPSQMYIGYYNFDNTNDCPIYVPASVVETYKTTEGWSKYASRIRAIGT